MFLFWYIFHLEVTLYTTQMVKLQWYKMYNSQLSSSLFLKPILMELSFVIYINDARGNGRHVFCTNASWDKTTQNPAIWYIKKKKKKWSTWSQNRRVESITLSPKIEGEGWAGRLEMLWISMVSSRSGFLLLSPLPQYIQSSSPALSASRSGWPNGIDTTYQMS